MIKITVGNSVSRIEGLTDSQLKAVRKITSYSVDSSAAYFSGSGHNTSRHLMSKRGEFPTGLLYLVRAWAKICSPDSVMLDHRTRPLGRQGLFSLSLPHTPYVEQNEAAEACYRYGRGVVSATTGTGKSLMIALTVELLQVPTLIVVPGIELKRQLTEFMTLCFGHERVGGLGSALAIENVDSLDPNKPLKGYDCVIIDEFHHSGAKTYRQLNQKAWNDVYYRFGFTATPFRSQDNERLLLESVLSKIIYRLGYVSAVAKNMIVPVEAYYIELPKKKSVEGNTWSQVYSELVTKNTNRNKVIASLIDTLLFQDRPTLCLVKEIAHGKAIQVAQDPPGTVEFATGTDDRTNEYIHEFVIGASKSLIGTTGVLGEGVDTKPAEYIIVAGLGKSKTQFMQQVGRGLRKHSNKESCKIIIFRDSSHKWTLAHYKAQAKILLDEYGVKVIRLDL